MAQHVPGPKRQVVMAADDTHDHSPHVHGGQPSTSKDAVQDPVCGMTVDPHTAKHRHTHNGRPYYFCSASCRGEVRGQSRASI